MIDRHHHQLHLPKFELHDISRRTMSRIMITGIALLALIGSFIGRDFGILILVGLGLAFLVWGMLANRTEPLLPGGLLSIAGLALLLTPQRFADQSSAGIITLALGIGFLLIFPLATVRSKHQWGWAIMPKSFLTVTGIALIIGGIVLEVLSMVIHIWPILLIVAGAYLLWELYAWKYHK